MSPTIATVNIETITGADATVDIVAPADAVAADVWVRAPLGWGSTPAAVVTVTEAPPGTQTREYSAVDTFSADEVVRNLEVSPGQRFRIQATTAGGSVLSGASAEVVFVWLNERA